ncbi:MAG TPA: bifunctional DNA-binding transcriptional regulator/O6-methylguanine-DNA methyltransferase Ada [Caulobacteraceae bacterium]|nr:bifunctional DNA-binding transcriptional regulator/O6-methylguanine-DNA methyltransferase Ada [Caulobacteraceae bacterium]
MQIDDASLDEARWTAVCTRTAAPDADFLYAVKTTGIYCLPGCASRRPRRENVCFYPSATAARAAGFRPCLRCRPDEPKADGIIAQACRTIEDALTPPSLAALAAQAGLSSFHFQRRFKAVVGLTPAAYARAKRAERARAALLIENQVTAAIFDAGFSSSGRFYETSGERLGMTPSVFKKQGRGQTIRYGVGACWLGHVLAAATERGVCAISLGDDPDVLIAQLKDRFGEADIAQGGQDFQGTLDQVIALVEAPAKLHQLPLDIQGAAFQERVWQALTRIPPGRTASYAQVARSIGAPTAARAVARACATNAVAVAIPCHRVVRSDGAFSGYRWGSDRKKAILEREKKAKE